MVPPNFDGSLLFQIGGNDCSNNDSEHVINAYEVLLNDVKSFVPNAKIFVSAIPPRRGSDYLRYKIQNVNEFLHFRSTFDDNITFIDCPVLDQKLHFRNDGVHFSEYGRSIYVSNLRQSLIKNFQMVPLRRKPR
jgi:lysophospholipase L1-like esterase